MISPQWGLLAVLISFYTGFAPLGLIFTFVMVACYNDIAPMGLVIGFDFVAAMAHFA